jgi:hypothetical protein
LLELQDARGCWTGEETRRVLQYAIDLKDFTPEYIVWVQLYMDVLRAETRFELKFNEQEFRDTTEVLFCLKEFFQHRKEEWCLIEQKAKKYLSGVDCNDFLKSLPELDPSRKEEWAEAVKQSKRVWNGANCDKAVNRIPYKISYAYYNWVKSDV